jgi:hypothetical protein
MAPHRRILDFQAGDQTACPCDRIWSVAAEPEPVLPQAGQADQQHGAGDRSGHEGNDDHYDYDGATSHDCAPFHPAGLVQIPLKAALHLLRSSAVPGRWLRRSKKPAPLTRTRCAMPPNSLSWSRWIMQFQPSQQLVLLMVASAARRRNGRSGKYSNQRDDSLESVWPNEWAGWYL